MARLCVLDYFEMWVGENLPVPFSGSFPRVKQKSCRRNERHFLRQRKTSIIKVIIYRTVARFIFCLLIRRIADYCIEFHLLVLLVPKTSSGHFFLELLLLFFQLHDDVVKRMRVDLVFAIAHKGTLGDHLRHLCLAKDKNVVLYDIFPNFFGCFVVSLVCVNFVHLRSEKAVCHIERIEPRL